jgi:hypothetical protein
VVLDVDLPVREVGVLNFDLKRVPEINLARIPETTLSVVTLKLNTSSFDFFPVKMFTWPL